MAGVLQKLGFALRETGQALDRLGCLLQGNYAFREQLNRSRSLINVFDKQPSVGRNAFVAPSAVLSGDVSLGSEASVFYGAVLRGDSGKITVGAQSNIQDGSLIRTGPVSTEEHAGDTEIGARVTIGHNATLFGCKIEDEALIGMGATVLQGARVERGSMVAAGAVVAPGTVVPAGEIWGGNPAKQLRKLKPEESKFLGESADHYVNVSFEHLKVTSMSLEDIAKSKGLA